MLEPADQQYVVMGYIARPQGMDGTVLMIPDSYAPTLFDDIDLVRLKDTRGDLIPARIESIRVQEKNNRLSFFIKFDHITDRNQADALKNIPVYINRDKISHLLKDDAIDGFTSFEVRNEKGHKVGIVVEVTDNPAHPILIVQVGRELLLIPFVDEYVTEIDKKNAILYCQHLDQLTNL